MQSTRPLEKFCFVYRDVLVRGVGTEWVEDPEKLEELLMLPVNLGWLHKAIVRAPTSVLLKEVIRRPREAKDGERIALLHLLLTRLVRYLPKRMVFQNGLQQSDVIRRKHAVETLGMILWAAFQRPFVDFKQQVVGLMCEGDHAEAFFEDLIAELYVTARDDDEEEEMRVLAMKVILVLLTGCNILQQNSIVDHFRSRSASVIEMQDFLVTECSIAPMKEMGFQSWALLCEYRKHEARNPFSEYLEKLEVSRAHEYVFNLRSVLEACTNDLVRSTTGTYFAKRLQEDLVEWMDSTSDTLIALAGRFTSAFGAWISGMDAKEITEQKASVSHGSGDTDILRKALPPLLVKDPEMRCDLALWVRVRFLLFWLYEIFTIPRGRSSSWITILAEHDVAPWSGGHGGSLPQPLGCSPAVLQIFTFVSFVLQSNTSTGSAAKVALLTLRCFTENKYLLSLLFTVCFEDSTGLNALHVFERQRAAWEGSVAYVPASRRVDAKDSAVAIVRRNIEDESSMQCVDRSLAAVLYKQLACLLFGLSSSRAGSKLDEVICGRVIDVIHRLIVFQSRNVRSDERRLLLGIEWQFVIGGVLQVLNALSRQEVCVGNQHVFLSLCSRAAHVINMLLVSNCLNEIEKRGLIRAIIFEKNPIEILSNKLATTDSLVENGSARILQSEFANLRTVLFHFSAAAMMIEQHDPEKLSKADQSALEKELENKIENGLSNVQLKPGDRLSDGFQLFVESSEERNILKDFLHELLIDHNIKTR